MEQEAELGKTLEVFPRKARVEHNRVPDAPPFRVAQHTFYLGRWYYDGSPEFTTLAAAIWYRDQWLAGGPHDAAVPLGYPTRPA